MLDYLRKNAQSTLVYLMFAVIIIVFVFTFNAITPDQACGGAAPGQNIEALYTTGDEVLDTNWLNMATSLTIDPPSPGDGDLQAQYRFQQYKTRRFGGFGSYGFIYQSAWSDFGTDPTTVSPIASERAMNDLIETVLVAEEAKNAGLVVSDETMSTRLIGTFDYWYNEDTGEFEADKYDSMVRFQLGTSPSRLEHFVRMELLREAMITLMVGGLDITDAEMQFHHAAKGDKVDLEIAVVDDDIASSLVKADDATVTPWLAANQEKVETYYNEHKGRFDKAERVVVRGIQFRAANRARLDENSTDEDRAQLQKERDEARAKAEAAWTALAGDNAAAGADATAEATPEAEGDKAKDDKAKDDKAAEAEGGEAPEQKASPAAGVPVDLAAFQAAASEQSDHGPTKEAGGLFEEPRDRDRLGRYPFGKEVVEPIFGLAPGHMSEVIEVDTGFWIVRLESKLAAESKTLDQARMEIARDLYKQEQGKVLKKSLADELLASAKAAPDKGLDVAAAAVNTAREAADGEGITTSRTGLFARLQVGAYGPAAKTGQIPTLGDMPKLAKAAFQAGPDSATIDGVFEVDGGERLVVARWAAQESAGELNDEAKAAIRANLLRQKQRLVYRNWYDALLKQAITDGRVEATEAWRTYLDQARRNFVEAGGQLLPPPSDTGDEAQGS